MTLLSSRTDPTAEEAPQPAMSNGLTIDVEDWFHILDVGGPAIDCWSTLPSRVEKNTERLLEMFSRHGVRATFFVLGWIAEHYPSLVRLIARNGHEIGTHGYAHELVHMMGRDRFREDLRRSITLLEDASEQRILGHRAPGFSITREALWAFDVLVEEGLIYDASVCPTPHGHGGLPGSPHHPYRQHGPGGGSVWEFPISCLQMGPWSFPFSGGGYLRLLPYTFIRRRIHRLNQHSHPAVVYIHPREVDPDHPRLPMPLIRRFKSYVNLSTTRSKLEKLLSEFRFEPLRNLLPQSISLQPTGVEGP